MPTEAVTVFGAVEVLVVMVDVSCDLAGRAGGCCSDCRAAAKTINKVFIILQNKHVKAGDMFEQ